MIKKNNLYCLLLLFLSFQVNAQSIPLSQIVNSTSGEAGNKNIEIRPDETVVIDSSVNVGELTINGKLSCSNNVNFAEIKATTIFVNGVFDCGSTTEKFNKNLIISLKHNPNLIPKNTFSYRGIIVNRGGTLNLNGVSSKAGYVRLARTVSAGENTIVLDRAVNWSVGDEVLVAPTSYDPEQGETFKISSIDASRSVVRFASNFRFRHWGEKEIVNTKNGPVELNQSAEVSNLTRNILIRADESTAVISNADAAGAQLGGHVMVHKGGKAFIDSVEFYKMGQAGVMARYPFHWHLVGDGSGQYIKNSSIHRSFQRCVTVHGTNNTLVENNVCYDFKGHGFFFELGDEINNVMTRNLAVNARFPTSTKFLLASDNPANSVHGRFPAVSSFWIVNPQNTITHNVAAGSVGSGFWMAFANEVRKFNNTTKEFDGELLSTPVTTNTTEFSNNTAHGTRVGITWDGAPVFTVGQKQFNANNPNNAEDRLLAAAHYNPSVVPVFKNLITYKNLNTGIYFRGSTAVFDGGVMADNGWSFFLAFNQVVKNITVIGESKNNGAFENQYLYTERRFTEKQVGAVFYDGPLEMDNVNFINFPQTKKTLRIDNADIDVTAVPFMPIPGAAKYTALLQNLSFSPEPYYRMYAQKYDPSQMQAWTEVNNSNAVRDLDGSFTGVVGGLVLSSTPYTSFSKCSEKSFNNNPSFFRLKVCPDTTKSMVLWLHQEGAEGKTPYIIKRNDNEYSIPMDEWKVLDRIKDPNEIIYHVKNRLVSSENYTYEILLNDRITGNGRQSLGVMVNSEFQNEISPVFKLTGFGSQCYFSVGGTGVNSLSDLQRSRVSSYYSDGNDLYFRILSQHEVPDLINPDYDGIATEVNSGYHHIYCKEKVVNRIKGQIDDVRTVSGVTTISGWACDFGKKAQVDMHLYAGPNAENTTFVGATTANLTSDAAVAFACGDAGVTGHRFSYKVPANLVSQHSGKKIYFHGLSTSGKENWAISGSGNFSIGGNGADVVTPAPNPTPTPTPTPNPTPVVNVIKGYLGDVTTTNGVTTVPGWGCDFGKSAQIDLHIYAGEENGPQKMIGFAKANDASEDAVAEACGDSTKAGHRFNYKIPADVVAQNIGKKIFVYGISTSGKENLALIGSGKFTVGGNGPVVVPAPAPKPTETNGSFCSGKNEILWKCNGGVNPGTGWGDAGGGCFHKDNGVSTKCK